MVIIYVLPLGGFSIPALIILTLQVAYMVYYIKNIHRNTQKKVIV